MMVIVEVVMSHEGLKYNTKGRTIQTSHSIACTAGNVQLVLCLTAGGKAFVMIIILQLFFIILNN